MVVAKSHEEAMYAARKVKIDYEDLPAIITIEDALAANSFYPDSHALEHGDLQEATDDAEVHVSGTIHVGGQEHFYLETNTTLATPLDNGFLEVLSSTQNCMKTQNFCASVCGIPASKVVAKCKRMGGGFGGKETRSVFISCTAALAAHLLNCPVSINIERDLDMSITGQRHAFLIQYKAGCKKNGRLSYLQAQLYSNAGYSLDLSLPVMDRALFHCDNAYRWPALHVRGTLCRTNQPSHTAFRGFGGPQGLMVSETAILHLADTLGVHPEFIRDKNLYREGDSTHFGQSLRYFYLPRLWNDIHELATVQARREEVEIFNKQNKWRKRGICVLPTKFGISFTAKFYNQVLYYD
jgi:xanthine dehydrogenase/oxidase